MLKHAKKDQPEKKFTNIFKIKIENSIIKNKNKNTMNYIKVTLEEKFERLKTIIRQLFNKMS